jgi:magnesium transporter
MFRKRHPAPGAAPGFMVIPEGALPTRIHVIDYNADRIEEVDIGELRELAAFRTSETITWIDVQGLGNPSMLEELGTLFSIHPLALADVFNVPQRPKVEPYDENVLIITRMVRMPTPPALDMHQLSIVLGPRYVLSFQEHYSDVLEPVRERVRLGGSIIRHAGSDYLAYTILDAVIDGYYPVLESLGDHFEEFEDEIITRPTPEALRRIHFLRRELLALRRGIWPQRDAINSLIRDELPFITHSVQIYLRDCYDHIVQLADVVDNYRDLASSLMDMYLSSMSNRLNEIMKMLTLIATIFIPLTFIVGIYGMNFDYMPELHYRWAYPLLWLVMLGTAAGLALYFRHRGWIGDGTRNRSDDTHGDEGR